MTTTVTGADRFLNKLADIQSSGKVIARAGVSAACREMAAACESAAPGTIKEEVGYGVKNQSDEVVGRVGLVKFPRPGDGQDGPHGAYLERGTKFIAARRFIQRALQGSRSRAITAADRAVKNKFKSLANQG